VEVERGEDEDEGEDGEEVKKKLKSQMQQQQKKLFRFLFKTAFSLSVLSRSVHSKTLTLQWLLSRWR